MFFQLGIVLDKIHLNRLFLYDRRDLKQTVYICLAAVDLTMSDTNLKPSEPRQHG